MDVIAAVATPPGRGGVGVVKISGPGSREIAANLCRCEPAPRRCRYAAFYDAQGQVLDRGLLLFFQGPNSHTGEDVVELHGHGGPVVMDLLLRRVLALGARCARPGEFSERAFLNDKLDLLQAEAVADLISSASEQAARSAARSMEGAFSAQVHELVAGVIELRVYVEAMLDFPEEEIDSLAEAELQQRLAACRRALAAIIARAKTGRTLAEGVKLAIVGKPNVGKSSLLNQLAQTERAIVAAQPGTTRDTVEQQVLIDGIPIHVVDTAGLRAAGDPVEREGIRRARAAAEAADVALLVADVTEYGVQELENTAASLDVRDKALFVFNKIDLGDYSPGRRGEEGAPFLYVSAKTGAGMDALKQEIKNSVLGADYSENAFIARTRHVEALRQAGLLLEEAAKMFQKRRAVELFADDLSRVQQTLGALTGEYAPDDLLGDIFSRFCIGK